MKSKTKNNMENYWNKRFVKEQLIWGTEPSNIAVSCEKIFKENRVKDILIMGIGYGRNGKLFWEHGYHVDGVEISETAITIGKKFCPGISFIKGSVLDMAFDKKYDAIFCYDIIHLFKRNERKKIIANCINYCKDNGIIMISCFSEKDKTYGMGEMVEENTYKVKKGKTVHFFTEEEIKNIDERMEPIVIDNSIEEIETKDRKDEYSLIYGIYRKIIKTKNPA
jgi:2-polyprenyl-3-methyl-5-hydroxy-6-metoxy-1,4-benzoquinol methylase